MLPRQAHKPDGFWSVGLPFNHSHCLTCGAMIFIGGQIDFNDKGEQLNPGDLEKQTVHSMQNVGKALESAGASLSDLVKLSVYYRSDGAVDETDLLALLASCLPTGTGPGPVVTLIPLPELSFAGMEIEIDGIAMRDQNGPRLPRTAAWDPGAQQLPPPFSQALRCGEMVFIGGLTTASAASEIGASGSLTGQSPVVLRRLDGLLRQLGADLNDVVKTNIFNVEPGTAEDWRIPALTRAGFYREPGPAATGISLPRLWPDGVMMRNDVIAMRGIDGARLARQHVWPTGHWDWPVHLPYRHGIRCGDLVFLGGQVALTPGGEVVQPGDIVAQTRMAMDFVGRVLGELGIGFDNVVKVNAFYVGAVGPDVLAENGLMRFSYFTGSPGPASTGVPVPYLAYEDMMIEIDMIAMV
jgi:enamine deaminase RidA (YjgF/YER057c/UK114 family)